MIRGWGWDGSNGRQVVTTLDGFGFGWVWTVGFGQVGVVDRLERRYGLGLPVPV